MLVSRNVVSISDVSAVNLIVGWWLFACSMNCFISSLLIVQGENISSIYTECKNGGLIIILLSNWNESQYYKRGRAAIKIQAWFELDLLKIDKYLSVLFVWRISCTTWSPDTEWRKLWCLTRVNEELFQLCGTDHRISSAYHPQSNGLNERMNQTLTRAIVKFVNENHDDWDVHLKSILFAYRTSKNDSTKFNPFELMFGRAPVLPIEMEIR